MSALRVAIRRLANGVGLDLPSYATAGSAGLDLRAAITAERVLGAGERALVPTGFSVALPGGWEAQVRPRSGLALEHGLGILNSPGTIDADYRGEIGVVLINHGSAPVTLRRGERIAQLVIAPVGRAVLTEVDELAPTGRGAGGFGSTGAADRNGASGGG